MDNDINIKIAKAKQKASERRTQAAHIKDTIMKWPEFSNFNDIYVYVGRESKCGYLLVSQTELQLAAFETSSKKTEFEQKFVQLAASVLDQCDGNLFSIFEYISQENLDQNYGGSISRRLAN